MTNDLDTLRAALRDRAEADTDAAALLARVGPAYRRRRRRIAGSAAAAVAAVALAAMMVPGLMAGGSTPPVVLASPSPSPSASVRPGAIGSDPQTIHFEVGPWPTPARRTSWQVAENVERLTMTGGPEGVVGFWLDLTLTPRGAPPTLSPTDQPERLEQTQQASATIDGRPAHVLTAVDGQDMVRVTWQPADDVHAELTVHGTVAVDVVLAYAGTLRLDRPHPCATRLRATALPAGARLTGCIAESDERGTNGGRLTIRGGGGTVNVTVPPDGVFSVGVSPGAETKHLPSGRIYEELHNPYYTAVVRTPDPYAELSAEGAYGMAEVLVVADGLQPS